MKEVTIIGIDLAKRVFPSARRDGGRFGGVPQEAVARAVTAVPGGAAASAPWRWRPARRRTTGGARSRSSGTTVRLIPPIYVKPFVKRQKNDAADAEAIAEAASRPTMRFVALKTEEQQARAMIFRTRDLLVRQRTQLINALRGHLAEHGVVAPQGTGASEAAGRRDRR